MTDATDRENPYAPPCAVVGDRLPPSRHWAVELVCSIVRAAFDLLILLLALLCYLVVTEGHAEQRIAWVALVVLGAATAGAILLRQLFARRPEKLPLNGWMRFLKR